MINESGQLGKRRLKKKKGEDRMLLDLLANRVERESFMALAYWVATTDGSLGLPEIKMLENFSQETGIADWRQHHERESVSDYCNVFVDDLSRKIVYSNLMAIGFVDEYENCAQSRAVETVRKAFEISPEAAHNCKQWLEIVKRSAKAQLYFD